MMKRVHIFVLAAVLILGVLGIQFWPETNNGFNKPSKAEASPSAPSFNIVASIDHETMSAKEAQRLSKALETKPLVPVPILRAVREANPQGPIDAAALLQVYQDSREEPKARHKQREEVKTLGRFIGRHAPQTSLSFFHDLESSQEREAFASAAVEARQTRSPMAAVDWIEEIEEPAITGKLYGDIARRWARKDLGAASSWTQQLVDPDIQSRAAKEIARVWTDDDPQAALDWAVELADETVSQQALGAVAKKVALTNPEQAAELALRLPASPARVAAIQLTANLFAVQDLDSAAAWANVLTDTDARAAALPSIADVWAARDAGAAIEWIVTWEEESLQDTALELAASRWHQQDPEPAAAWVKMQKDQDLKERLVRQVGQEN